jgi:hypothetical protein
MAPDRTLLLRDAACEVLETMFYATPLEEPEPQTAPSPRTSAWLEFHGPHSGRFGVCAADAAARGLAEGFLGAEEEPGPVAVAEVLAELANMICGSLLARVEPEARYELCHPRTAPCTGAHAGRPGVEVPIEGGTIELYLE